MSVFEQVWHSVVKMPVGEKKSKFGEKFQRKLDSLKEGARGVPEKFSDLTPTTPRREGEDPTVGSQPNFVANERRHMRARSPFKPSQALIDRARSGTHTMPGSSKYRRDED